MVVSFGVNITEDVNAKLMVTVLGWISNQKEEVIFVNQPVIFQPISIFWITISYSGRKFSFIREDNSTQR